MGIPSFYHHLLRKINGLSSGDRTKLLCWDQDIGCDALCLDFNCAVYAALGTCKVEYKRDAGITYERALRQEVIRWLERIVSLAAPREKVYVALDGVVPMAKIRQQRLRRFKSVWTKEQEELLSAKYSPNTPQKARWDTNAITPGTEFMAELNKDLNTWAAKRNAEGSGLKCIVSTTDEPGEGEHKIMRFIDSEKPNATVIYGLDADLILLSMLHAQKNKNKIILLREDADQRATVTEAHDVLFAFFDPVAAGTEFFKKYANKGVEYQAWLRDYICIMSILGNDFLPHSLGWAIREDSIQFILRGLEDICAETKDRLVAENGQINNKVLAAFFSWASRQEEGRVKQWLEHKKKWRPPAFRATDDYGKALEQWQNEPMRFSPEDCMLDARGYLEPLWRKSIEKYYFKDAESTIRATGEFIKGVHWVNAYYWNSSSVDVNWFYPWSGAPTFATLDWYMNEFTVPNIPADTNYVTPLQQLCLVLPIASFDILPAGVAKQLSEYRAYFPNTFGLDMLGKRYLWECDPQIPILPREIAQEVTIMKTLGSKALSKKVDAAKPLSKNRKEPSKA